MTSPQRSVRSARKVSREIRQELLDTLGVPKGAATVARRPAPEGDVLVVRLMAPDLLPTEQRCARFQGFPVTYEIVRPLKIRRL